MSEHSEGDVETLPQHHGDIVPTQGRGTTRSHASVTVEIVEDEDGPWFKCPECAAMFKSLHGKEVEDYV